MAFHVDFRSESRMRRAENITFMPHPLPLVITTVSGFRINPEAIDILQDVVQPVTVIGIAGEHREGKSYLANWFLGEETGFPISSSFSTETKGIWFWCRPHPYNPDSHLIVLDTEGLEDPAKGDISHDINIFTLTVLISSYFILNSRGTIGDHSIQLLRYVTEMVERVRVKEGKFSSRHELSSYFPKFCWVLRDCFLKPEIDGKSVTPKQYLENCLRLKEQDGNSPMRQTQHYNSPRKALKQSFRERECFLLPRPVDDERRLQQLESIPRDQLKASFVNQVNEVCKVVLTQTRPYSVYGQQMNGSMWLDLLETYVATINGGELPVLSNAFVTMSTSENGKLIETAIGKYETKMVDAIGDGMEAEDLMKVHDTCHTEVFKYFRENQVGDYIGEGHMKLEKRLKSSFESLRDRNYKESKQYCESTLAQLLLSIQEKAKSGAYTVPGGYELYRQHSQEAKEKYQLMAKGPAKLDVLKKSFYEDRASEDTLIRQSDAALKTLERDQAEITKRQEAQELRNKAAEDEKRHQETLLKLLAASHERELNYFKDMLTRELERIRKDHDDALKALRHEMASQKQKLKAENELLEAKLKYHQRKIEEMDKTVYQPKQPLPKQTTKTDVAGFVVDLIKMAAPLVLKAIKFIPAVAAIFA